jgi:hypothetical protein
VSARTGRSACSRRTCRDCAAARRRGVSFSFLPNINRTFGGRRWRRGSLVPKVTRVSRPWMGYTSRRKVDAELAEGIDVLRGTHSHAHSSLPFAPALFWGGPLPYPFLYKKRRRRSISRESRGVVWARVVKPFRTCI